MQYATWSRGQLSRSPLGTIRKKENLMNGPIAQIIALTSYGNAILKGDVEVNYGFDNSTAKFCSKIRFIDWLQTEKLWGLIKSKNRVEVSISENFDSWVRFLIDNKIDHLWLHYYRSEKAKIPDRISTAFVGGGGRWLIEAKHSKGSDFWEARWDVTNKDAADSRIWTVTYVRTSKNYKSNASIPTGLDIITLDLQDAIISCKEFSEKHKLDYYQKCFAAAFDCLTSGNFSSDLIYHKDFIPVNHFSTEAKRVLYSCQPAWVFGGMGSWNDIWYEGDVDVYNHISDKLYYTICEALCRATNSFSQTNCA